MDYSKEGIEDPELYYAIQRVRVAEDALLEVNEEMAEAKKLLLDLLQSRDTNTVSTMAKGHVFKVTFVQGSRVIVDGEGLQAQFGKRLWNTWTERKVNHKLIEQAIQEGKVKAEDVAPYITVQDTAAFPRISVRSLEAFYE